MWQVLDRGAVISDHRTEAAANTAARRYIAKEKRNWKMEGRGIGPYPVTRVRVREKPAPYLANPAKRAVRPSSFYSGPKWPAEIKAKDHPLGHTIRYSTVKEAQSAAKRLANMYGVPVAVTINDDSSRTYAKNPRGIGGIGYYSYTNPESGEKIIDDDLERIKRTARKLANRLGRAIQVRADYSGRRVK